MRKNRGFTLIELLIVVAIIGIIAAIAIPNLLNAINRGRQKRSMADIRTVGTATEAYAVDASEYPTYTAGTVGSGYDNNLQPTYIKAVPDNDGWRSSFRAASAPQFYSIGSSGKDKAFTSADLTGYTAGTTTGDMDCDIIFSNGSFLQYPEGVQTE